MNNYKKQLNDTGTDIITHCNSIILENNKKIPDVLEKELDRQLRANDPKKGGPKGAASILEDQTEREKAAEQRAKLVVKQTGF